MFKKIKQNKSLPSTAIGNQWESFELNSIVACFVFVVVFFYFKILIPKRK